MDVQLMIQRWETYTRNLENDAKKGRTCSGVQCRVECSTIHCADCLWKISFRTLLTYYNKRQVSFRLLLQKVCEKISEHPHTVVVLKDVMNGVGNQFYVELCAVPSLSAVPAVVPRAWFVPERRLADAQMYLQLFTGQLHLRHCIRLCPEISADNVIRFLVLVESSASLDSVAPAAGATVTLAKPEATFSNSSHTAFPMVVDDPIHVPNAANLESGIRTGARTSLRLKSKRGIREASVPEVETPDVSKQRVLSASPIDLTVNQRDTLAAPKESMVSNPSSLGSSNVRIVCLECRSAFESLSSAEKLYAYHCYRAAWAGSVIGFSQRSPDSFGLLLFFLCVFRYLPPSRFRKEGVEQDSDGGSRLQDEEAVNQFLWYVACFATNGGMFRSDDGVKIVMPISSKRVRKILVGRLPPHLYDEWIRVHEAHVFGTHANQLGFADDLHTLSGHYSGSVTSDDAKRVQTWLNHEGQADSTNTHVEKVTARHFVVRVGACLSPVGTTFLLERARNNQDGQRFSETEDANRRSVRRRMVIEWNHCAKWVEPLLQLCTHLDRARKSALQPVEVSMMEAYTGHFLSGRMELFYHAQQFRCQTSSSVEMAVGFMNTYSDPCGVRGEFEGMVGLVDRGQTSLFKSLAEAVPRLCALLPWYHTRGAKQDANSMVSAPMEGMVTPLLTVVRLLVQTGGQMPIAVNVLDDSFSVTPLEKRARPPPHKSLLYANVLAVSSFETSSGSLGWKPAHLLLLADQDDMDCFRRDGGTAMHMNTALHELVGHGSGRVFRREESRTGKGLEKNSSLDGDRTESYGPGESFETVFGGMASAFEECRADAVVLYLLALSLGKHPNSKLVASSIFRPFDSDPTRWASLASTGWMEILLSGLVGLSHYDPKTRQWNAPHAEAQFALLHLLFSAGVVDIVLGNDLSASETSLSVSESTHRLRIVHDLVATTGLDALTSFLLTMQRCRATGNVREGGELFRKWTRVDEKWMEVHAAVLRALQGEPERWFVQPALSRDSQGGVHFKEFDPSIDGVIESFLSHYADVDVTITGRDN